MSDDPADPAGQGVKRRRALLDDKDWPKVDERRLQPAVKAVFEARVAALCQYAQGQPLVLLREDTAITISSIYRWIDRAQQLHADGRPWGYRALLPYARVKTYERTREPKVLKEGKAGNAGAFTQLLIRHPKLALQLRKELTSGSVKLMPSSNEEGRLQGVVGALGRFQRTCRELGLTAADYPLSQHDKCIRSLARHLRAMLKADTQLSAKAAGVLVKPASALRDELRDAPRAFDTVEFDAHKLDLRLKVILDRDPAGGEHAVPIERAWLLAVIDVTTRCILGWHLVFGKECNRFDVIEALRRAVLPIPRPELRIPGGRLIDGGGYACEVMLQTKYAVWRQIRLDNARAHLSADCLDLLCDTLGCQVDFGPAYHPDDRPFIERYFATVVQTFSRRLPGAIEPKGESDRMRLLGQLRDKKGTDRLVVSAQELDELLAMMVWNYNGTPHSSLGGLTPLEVMQHHVLGIGRDAVRLRHLPAMLQRQPRLLHDPIDCLVHGNVARGERPHISYLHVRYTSKQLANRSDLIGKAIHIHIDPQDLRAVTAVTSNGEILEPLWASGAWRNHVHSVWLRREFFAAKRRKQLDYADGDDPIASFVAQRKKAAIKSKRAATDVARLDKEQRQRSKDQVAPNDGGVPPATSGIDPLSQLVTGPVKGKTLRIERGFAR